MMEPWPIPTANIFGSSKVKRAIQSNTRGYFTPFGNDSLTIAGNMYGISK
jgi:hypothetical protein